ncbi:hypothetical protein OGAPHI_000454 [Ogataea philodendri]|uniref:Protein FMP42 n=1 Tax=Ogataea philodendri TaxID=1378263 RepID=A0A9P8TAM2_9ASCO|nr:uncharacterized protein OGAPHI_000454 [Ogataea philodendri]KAH3671749.1 hypothetical protein OGAPHI_000454 [Ogataea philodendri]
MPATENTPLVPVATNPLKDQLPSLKIRVFQVVCALIWCLFAAGPIFGFAALKPILIDQGVYKEICDTVGPDALQEVCTERDLKLNFMFTLGAVVTNATALVVGSILDNYGPRVTGIIGAIAIFISSLCLRNGATITFFDAYLFGYIGLAFGGPFVFISSFQLANSFPGKSGSVLALLTGAFDSSSALFLIYRLIYQNDLIHNLTLKKFFTAYLVVPIFIFVCQVTVMPSESYKTVETLAKMGETGIDESGLPMDPEDLRYTGQEVQAQRSRRNSIKSIRSTRSTKSVYEEIADSRLHQKSGGIFGVLHDKSLKKQITSPWYILMCCFATIQMLRVNYFVATIRSQMEFYFQDEGIAIGINKFFDVALPVGGLFAIPFIGLLLDNFKTLTVLTILYQISLTIGVFGMIPLQFVQYLGILMLVVYRPFYYTAVSDFCAKVFGYRNFGTVYGSLNCISGIFNLFQALLDKSTHTVFHMNPNPVNLLLVLLTALSGAALLGYIKSQEIEVSKSDIIREALDSEVVEIGD